MWYTALHQVRTPRQSGGELSRSRSRSRSRLLLLLLLRLRLPLLHSLSELLCPSPVWCSALHELTSRVGHPHEGVRAAVVELLARVLADYPRQAMWAINGLVCSKNAARRSAGTNIVKQAQRAIERNTTGNHTAAASGGGGGGADRAAAVAMGRRIAGSDRDDNGARALAQAMRSRVATAAVRVCVRVQEMASLQDDLSGWLSCIASSRGRARSPHDEGWRGSDPSSRGHVVT